MLVALSHSWLNTLVTLFPDSCGEAHNWVEVVGNSLVVFSNDVGMKMRFIEGVEQI